MWLLSRPNTRDIAVCLADQRSVGFSYPDVGATRTQPPRGYDVDRNRCRLGTGAHVFDRARAAVREWAMMPAPFARIEPARAAIDQGTTAVVVVRALGVWWLNPVRIVYVIDEPRRFGFAYGTLPDHMERGEERFLIEHDDDDHVWYGIVAFSQPRWLPARLAYPAVRVLQRRFARESMTAMQKRSILGS